MKGNIEFGFVLLMLLSCKAQELKSFDQINNRVMVHVADTTVKAELLEGKIDADFRYTYFWFDNGQVNSAQGAYSGKLLHGNYKSYHSDSKILLAQGQFDRGLKTGNWLGWRENGNLKSRSSYKDGLLDGDLLLFDTAGKPVDTLEYRKGILKIERLDTIGVLKKLKRLIRFKIR